MTALKRVFYTSEVVPAKKDEVSFILKQSVRNNTVQGITGVLLQHDGHYLQVLEGEERDVDALLTRLRADPRHKRMRIRFTELTETRMFHAWSMAHPAISDRQIRLTLQLLTSELPASQEVGLTFLKYWLTSHAVEPGVAFDQSSMRVNELEQALQEDNKARNFSAFLFCSAILFAVVVDAGFFISEYLDGMAESVPMLQSYAVAASGLLLSMWYARTERPCRAVATFRVTALVTVAAHMFWAGYGIHAPSLPYLGLAIASGVLSNRQSQGRLMGGVSLALVAIAVILSLSASTAPYFTNQIASHHEAMAGLLFPVLCMLILESHNRDRVLAEQFTTGVLADLTDTIASLKKSMAARNYFFSAISHEIRTPMTGVMSAVNVIEHPKASPEVKARSTSALRYSLSNLNRLLNDLLDISKLESGKFEMSVAPFDISAATRNIVELYAAAVEEGGNTLTVSIAQTPLFLNGDQQRFEQMLSNLLGNAVKYTKNGTITVNLKPVDNFPTPMKPETAHWRCEVSDSGIGVPPDEIAKLFQPFSQASQNGFSATKGTGLGLAIVAALARQLDGSVGVDSTEGKGSTFWFTFKMPVCEHEALRIKTA